MTYREHVQWMKKYWTGKTVSYKERSYKVVDVNYDCELLIKKTPYTETTAVDPLEVVEDATPDPSESGGERKEDYTSTPAETGTGCLETTPTPTGEDEGQEAAEALIVK